MDFQRARNREQKDLRWEQIKEAALKLYSEHSWHQITMSSIARELDFTRANLYKYAKTKEEIFLNILLEDFQAWITHVIKDFPENTSLTPENFALKWSQILSEHTRFLELFALLNTIIEKNVSVESLTVFKKSFFRELPELSQVFERNFPGFTYDQTMFFLESQYLYALSLYAATTNNEVQKEALKRAGIPCKTPDFTHQFAQFLTILIKGMQISPL